MTFEQTIVLAAIAGATIFIGLPVGRLRNLTVRTQVMLTTAAAGVILFLIWDILSRRSSRSSRRSRPPAPARARSPTSSSPRRSWE